ncbi:hypothetical protein QG37_05336 [Candidozyma auris]|nr:hypothetical protein QG37_05336 [[Candida] auris]
MIGIKMLPDLWEGIERAARLCKHRKAASEPCENPARQLRLTKVREISSWKIDA